MSRSNDDVTEELRSQLEDWNMGIDELQSRVERAEAERRADLRTRIEAFRENYEEARKRFESVSAKGEKSWDEFREGMKQARSLLDEALEETQPEGDD